MLVSVTTTAMVIVASRLGMQCLVYLRAKRRQAQQQDQHRETRRKPSAERVTGLLYSKHERGTIHTIANSSTPRIHQFTHTRLDRHTAEDQRPYKPLAATSDADSRRRY